MNHPNPSTAIGRVLIDELVRNGVDSVVVAPGSRSAPLALAASADERVDVTVALDERSAGFYALGRGKIGRTTAVIVTSGTAVANLFPAVLEASMSATPLVLLTADRPPELRGVGANQTVDQIAMFGHHVRLFVEMGVPEDRPESNAYWRSTVCRALACVRGDVGRPGPVHINIALREPLVPASHDGRVGAVPFASDTDGRFDGRPWSVSQRSTVAGPALPVDTVAVERGLVVAGGGADVEWCDRTAAALGWPLVCEASAGGRPPQSISTAHLLASAPGFVRDHQPDVVLAVGRIGLSRSLNAMLAGGRRISVDPGAWTDPTRTAELVLSSYPTIEAASIPERTTAWRRSWLAAERSARAGLDAALDAEPAITELRVARDAARAARGSVLVVGSSMPIRDLDAVLEPGSVPVVSNRGASGIDGFVATTFGVSSGQEDGAAAGAVGLAGDLTMLHDQNGFLLDPRPAGVFVVIDNDGGGIFSFLPQADQPEHFERVFGTPHGRSFEDYARFHHLEYQRIDDPSALTPSILERRAAGGLHLVHVRTDRATNVKAHRRITEAVVTGLAGT